MKYDFGWYLEIPTGSRTGPKIISQGHKDDVGFASEKTWRSVPIMSACLKVGLCLVFPISQNSMSFYEVFCLD